MLLIATKFEMQQDVDCQIKKKIKNRNKNIFKIYFFN